MTYIQKEQGYVEKGRPSGVERDWGLYRAPLPGDLLFTKQLQEPGFAGPVVPLQQLHLQAILLSQSLNENEFDRFANELLLLAYDLGPCAGIEVFFIPTAILTEDMQLRVVGMAHDDILHAEQGGFGNTIRLFFQVARSRFFLFRQQPSEEQRQPRECDKEHCPGRDRAEEVHRWIEEMLPDEIWDHVRQKPGRRKENGKKEDEHHEGEHCQDTPRAQDDADNLRPPVGLFQDAPCAPAIQIFQLCKLDSRLAGQLAKANVVLLFANIPRFRKNVCPCTANPAEQISAVTEGEAEGGNRVFPEQPPDKPRGRLDIVRKRLDSFHPVEEVPHEE